jgi:molecular chaperone GrpE
MVYPTEEAPEGHNEAECSPQEPGKDSASSSPVDQLQNQYDELNERYLRLAADFDNFKRRTARDRDVQVRAAVEEFAVALLEVIDNFDRALRQEGAGSAREGLEQISKLLNAVLTRHGIQPIESIGKKFNPAEHEAVHVMASPEDEGIVIDEVSRGYCMDQKVIRCARVVVSKGKEND